MEPVYSLKYPMNVKEEYWVLKIIPHLVDPWTLTAYKITQVRWSNSSFCGTSHMGVYTWAKKVTDLRR